MPSQILHALAGKAAFRNSRISGKHVDPAAFNLGCQGPDVFSHNRRTKPFALAYSRLLHRHDYGRFCRNIAENLPAGGDTLVESWFYGFITHQVLDRLFHPYIINRSFVAGPMPIEGVTPAHFHAFLERILDVLVLTDIEHRDLNTFDTGSPFTLSETGTGRLADAISMALEATYPLEAAKDQEIRLRVINAFADTMYFYNVTNPVFTMMSRDVGCSQIQRYIDFGIRGAALLYPEGLDRTVDWLNASRKPWIHPVSGDTLHVSVEDLYHESVAKAASVIDFFETVRDGRASIEAFEQTVGNDCLSVSGPDGKIATVRFYESFDLGTALLAQAEKRKAWLERTVC